ISWPEIKESRYQNLASGTNCYIDNDTEINKQNEWANHDNDNNYPDYDNDMEDEWFPDTAGSTSWHYYPYAPRLILNNIDTGASAENDLSQYIPPATLNIIDYSSITNGIIYAQGDLSVSGIIPTGQNLTIVSGGNIFVDSNLLKETNTASLALLAKENIVLNPTLRYAVDWTSPDDSWQDGSGALANPGEGTSTYPGTETISIPSGVSNTYIIDLDLGKLVTGGRIILWGYQDGEGSQIDTTLDVFLSRDAANWDSATVDENPSGDYHLDFTPQTFRWVRFELEVENTHPTQDQDFNLSSEGFDAIEVPIYAVDAALFTEDGSLEVVTGGGMDQVESILPNNNAYQPDADGLKVPSDSGIYSQRLFFWGTLTETEWTESIPDWEYIAYAYDDNLSSSPPPSLPPSVNLV
ncbi:hypothetical protein LCGC14_2801900, partial [marine sediment metagenome]